MCAVYVRYWGVVHLRNDRDGEKGLTLSIRLQNVNLSACRNIECLVGVVFADEKKVFFRGTELEKLTCRGFGENVPLSSCTETKMCFPCLETNLRRFSRNFVTSYERRILQKVKFLMRITGDMLQTVDFEHFALKIYRAYRARK